MKKFIKLFLLVAALFVAGPCVRQGYAHHPADLYFLLQDDGSFAVTIKLTYLPPKNPDGSYQVVTVNPVALALGQTMTLQFHCSDPYSEYVYLSSSDNDLSVVAPLTEESRWYFSSNYGSWNHEPYIDYQFSIVHMYGNFVKNWTAKEAGSTVLHFSVNSSHGKTVTVNVPVIVTDLNETTSQECAPLVF